MAKKREITPEEAQLFHDRIQRIFEALRVTHRTQVVLADILDIRQSSISDAKRRASIPAEWLLHLYMQYNIRPEYILNGSLPISKYAYEGSDISVPAILAPHMERIKRAFADCIEAVSSSRDLLVETCVMGSQDRLNVIHNKE